MRARDAAAACSRRGLVWICAVEPAEAPQPPARPGARTCAPPAGAAPDSPAVGGPRGDRSQRGDAAPRGHRKRQNRGVPGGCAESVERGATGAAAGARDLAHAAAYRACARAAGCTNRDPPEPANGARARAAVVAGAPRRGDGRARQQVGGVRADPEARPDRARRGRVGLIQAGPDASLRGGLGCAQAGGGFRRATRRRLGDAVSRHVSRGGHRPDGARDDAQARPRRGRARRAGRHAR